MADVCFLWHMHQPQYVDPESGVALLPWVRCHATRAYLDMAQILEEHPGVRATVNFVPSLVEQLELYLGGAIDRYEQVAAHPADALDAAEREFAVARFFSVHWGRLLDPHPRYRELLAKRGRDLAEVDLPERARRFSVQDLLDLTVLFQLAQLGFTARKDPAVRELLAKERGYTEADKAHLLALQRALAGRVLPAWRRLAERGQVELTASPYYHPIVPLLIDTETARRAMPGARLPPRFAFPADARDQIRRAIARHARAFGGPPAGMWPPEGSVSPEAVALYADEGVRFLVTDEGNLARSLDGGFDRTALYGPYRLDGEVRIDLLFRDRELSDRIGFAYASGGAEAGVGDLLARLAAIAAASRPDAEDSPLVTIALDGENAWESYDGLGEPFLRLLYTRLSEEGAPVRTRTVSEALASRQRRGTLQRLHSGSWIDSDFHVWIADPDKNRAWTLLGELRARLASAEARRAPGAAQAREHVLAAEGSDWFWWFGEPFHSAEDPVFDGLFRAHLRAAYRALGEEPATPLDEPVARNRSVVPVRPIRAFVRPRLRGDGRSFLEWEGAGLYVPPRGVVMGEGMPLVERIHFGFDESELFLRIDPARAQPDALRDLDLETTIQAPGRETSLRAPLRGGPVGLAVVAAEPVAVARAQEVGAAVAGAVVEVRIPFAAVGLQPGARLQVALKLWRGDFLVARYPRDGWLALVVPSVDFETRVWVV